MSQLNQAEIDAKAKADAGTKTKEVRVLVDCVIDGQSCKPNDTPAVDVDLIKQLEKDSKVDANAKAVAYAKTQQPKKVADDEVIE